MDILYVKYWSTDHGQLIVASRHGRVEAPDLVVLPLMPETYELLPAVTNVIKKLAYLYSLQVVLSPDAKALLEAYGAEID
jgi:hypothetical protein